ncbi:YrhK family protein [Microbacterium halotolerans]|uniref:YrhK family protein n=1 Tax=Microbacterium halotolerans TaxID=246613 RepID=UPI000E6AC2E2|nr:YrhK family protein [Microbacterium halotolerans]
MGDTDILIRIGHEEIVLRRRYEVLSIVNDILIAVWFIIGSILFFSSETSTVGTWLFLVGSVQLLCRPAIRLVRHVHVRRVGSSSAEASDDF